MNVTSLASLTDRLPLQRLGFARKRFVALVGDEGVVLAHVIGREVRRRVFAPAPTPEASEALMETLASAPSTPLHVVIDVLEQHYRETDLPNVSVIDRGKVVKRKLALTFPEDNLTGALPLPQREDAGRNDMRYMFVAAPVTEGLQAWFDLFAKASNPVDSVSLLPVEAVGLAAALEATRAEGSGAQGARATSSPADGARNWQLLLTRQRCSGFRQTIIHGGRLVFTRLTPSLEADSSTEELVENIEREFASTISYLRRLSVSDADRVSLLVLAEPQVCAALDPRRLRIKNLTSMSPAEAASLLDLDEVADEQDGFSDILYAAWQAQRAAPTLSIDTPQMRQARLTAMVPKLANVASILLALAGLAAAALTWVGNNALAQDNRELENQNRQLEIQRQEIEGEVGTLEVAPERVEAALSGFSGLVEAEPSYRPLLGATARALQPGMIVENLRVEVNGPPLSPAELYAGREDEPRSRRRNRDEEEAPAAGTIASLRMTVRLSGPFTSRDEVRARFDAFIEALSTGLPDYGVSMTRAPFNTGDGERLVGTAGLAFDADPRRMPDFVTADFRVEGPA